MLIGSDGKRLGLMSREEALQNAGTESLDLVQVSQKDRFQLFVSSWITVNMFLQRKNISTSMEKPRRGLLKK